MSVSATAFAETGHGILTGMSTPPDPHPMTLGNMRANGVRSLDVSCRRTARHHLALMPTGTVKWFNSQKGYGFIQPQGGGGRDVFVHISAVEKAGLTGLNEGQIVQYEEVSNRGKTSAENLKVK
jgi:cold shock protein